ncbi:MAG TPA: TIR domain-containing protein [Euzebyales bacterium]
MTTNRDPAVIRVESPPEARATHRLPVGRSIVGRDPAAGVAIASEYVSRRHAELHWDGDRVSVRDLGSQNGTHVNDRPATDWVDLSDGDVIRFGPVEAVVEVPAASTRSGLSATRDQMGADDLPAAPRDAPVATARTVPLSQVPIFVSHSSEDKTAARMIADHLRRRGWNVWIDEAGIAGGKEWHGELMRALEAAWIVLLVVSFHSMRSRWVIREVQAADRLGLKVIPVVVDDAPYPDELRMILSGVQQLPLTERRDAARRNRQLAGLDDALLLAARAGREGRPGKVLIAIGSVISAIGAIGCIVGFALFAYLGFAEVNDPSIGGGGIPPPFIGWGVFAASIVVVGVGQALRRAGLKKGI